jgi:hypothetical protein
VSIHFLIHWFRLVHVLTENITGVSTEVIRYNNLRLTLVYYSFMYTKLNHLNVLIYNILCIDSIQLQLDVLKNMQRVTLTKVNRCKKTPFEMPLIGCIINIQSVTQTKVH